MIANGHIKLSVSSVQNLKQTVWRWRDSR